MKMETTGRACEGAPANDPPSMRHPEKRPQLDRRGFMRSGGLAAIGVSVVPATLTMMPAEVYAKSFGTLGETAGRTLIKMARDIFPHDKLPDRFYAEAVTPYDTKAANDRALRTLLLGGVADLDTRARRQHGQPYLDVPSENERVALLKAIEPGAFFQKVKGDLITGLYNNKALWPLFGYEGSSWEKGGYVNRGFNDIDWL
ncbi:gluconate 2-dehydrogenase subunit 3 family protein [Azohydromonas lata]|uniref:Gluconate 2-dehydrogenase subunit 3 family protein n=1 Tax=Azohydromonas lata TaxID=45677 RepID=A0ABU5IED2_9BURK|nr:gluconate 2-dehydrogenase subunit 3 family protein [Azohydromonas lata]MDZ5456875.1 gluconate 2-dehydrogenase subunit 3 family protein [Azohydromonas lata]